MLTVFYSTDTDKKAKAIDRLILSAKKEGREIVVRNDIDAQTEELASVFENLSLFGTAYMLVLDGAFASEAVRDYVLSHLENIEASPTHCVISEEVLSKETLALLTKHAESVEEYALPKKKEEKGWSPFAFTDAVGERDKKRAWLLLAEANVRDISSDELLSALFWLVKTISLVGALADTSAVSSGLNPFVHKKAMSFKKNFSTSEIETLRARIVKLYHETRRGLCDINVGLETLVLESL